MGKTIDLAKEMDQLAVVSENDLILGYSKSGNKVGWMNASHITKGGYACRRWNMNHSSPVGEAVGNIEYLRNLPALLGLGCYLVDKNHGRRKLDPTNHYKFATGETAKLDGSMGDYMWGWNTKWYYAWWVEGGYYYEAASLNPIPGKLNYLIPVASVTALGYSVVDRTNLELVSVINKSAQFRGGDNQPALDGAFNSQLGKVASSLNATTVGEYARKKGEGWEAGWYTHIACIGILFRLVFGNRDIQAAYNSSKDKDGLYQGGLGNGCTTAGAWWSGSDGYNMFPFLQTDVAVDLGDACGVKTVKVPIKGGSTVDVQVPVFFGLKHPFGYMRKWERGIIIKKKADGCGEVYVTPKMYSSYSITSVAGMVKVAEVPKRVNSENWMYISQISMQNLCHKPTVTQATASTGYCDGYYNDNAASGLRVPVVGTNADNGAISGPECVAVNIDGSWAVATYGSLLCEAAENWDSTPTLMP